MGRYCKIWNKEGNLQETLKPAGRIYSTVFPHEGHRILTASRDGIAGLWGLEGNYMVKLDMHIDGVTSAVFPPGGNCIFTASWDGTAILWDLEGNLQIDLDIIKTQLLLRFSPDNRRILTASKDGIGKLWD